MGGLRNGLGVKCKRVTKGRRATVAGKFQDNILGFGDVDLDVPRIEPVFKNSEVGREGAGQNMWFGL